MAPPQPNFAINAQFAEIQSGMGHQLGAPFELQIPAYNYMQGHFYGQIREPNHPQPGYYQPMAGPSRLAAEPVNNGVMRDFNAELEESFRRRHSERVRQRGIQQPRTTIENPPQLPPQAIGQRPNEGVYTAHAALRNQRDRDLANQNNVELQAFEAQQQHRSQHFAAENNAEYAAHVQAQQQIQTAIIQQAHAVAIQQAARRLPPGRDIYQEPESRHSVGHMNYACSHCGALHFLGEKLANSSVFNPAFGGCCLEGQISLPMPSMPPQPLQDLMNGKDPRSHRFLEHIRQYNSAFAFTSTAVNMNQQVLNTSGPYAFIIHGELHHFMGSLLPEEGSSPRYAQLYIHDPHAALCARNANNRNLLNPGIMNDLQDMLL